RCSSLCCSVGLFRRTTAHLPLSAELSFYLCRAEHGCASAIARSSSSGWSQQGRLTSCLHQFILREGDGSEKTAMIHDVRFVVAEARPIQITEKSSQKFEDWLGRRDIPLFRKGVIAT